MDDGAQIEQNLATDWDGALRSESDYEVVQRINWREVKAVNSQALWEQLRARQTQIQLSTSGLAFKKHRPPKLPRSKASGHQKPCHTYLYAFEFPLGLCPNASIYNSCLQRREIRVLFLAVKPQKSPDQKKECPCKVSEKTR